ncbi:MAG: MmgE/PrpD family protein [Rhodobacteraceae bacterium]|nr:MmgE/PrpD family protein [Paracoccaceae bacterium]
MTDRKAEAKVIAETLADWAIALQLEAIPDSVRQTFRNLLLDCGGLMLSARNTDYVRAILSSCEAGGDCTAIGHPHGFTASDAALISGVAIHGEDYDDTFEGTPVHVGSVVVPAVVAACERHGLSGSDLLRGMTAGGELACRMALVAPTAIHRAAFHPTAVIGAMASAFGVSVARSLTPSQTANALGIAGSMASGIIEYLAEGASTKRLHPGWAAQSGLRAASLAANGLSGPRTVFEGVHGFFNAFADAAIPRDFDRLKKDLGKVWEVENIAFKPYACGTMAQPFIDAAISLRGQIGNIDSIQEIMAPTSEGIVHRLWEPAQEKARPSTAYSAKFSIPYCIAIGLSKGTAGLQEFNDEAVRDDSVLRLAAKVRYQIDPDDPYPENYVGALTATLEDGTKFEARQPCLRGGRAAPLSRTELMTKFNANASFGGWPEDTARAFIEFCQQAFELPDLRSLARFQK